MSPNLEIQIIHKKVFSLSQAQHSLADPCSWPSISGLEVDGFLLGSQLIKQHASSVHLLFQFLELTIVAFLVQICVPQITFVRVCQILNFSQQADYTDHLCVDSAHLSD